MRYSEEKARPGRRKWSTAVEFFQGQGISKTSRETITTSRGANFLKCQNTFKCRRTNCRAARFAFFVLIRVSFGFCFSPFSFSARSWEKQMFAVGCKLARSAASERHCGYIKTCRQKKTRCCCRCSKFLNFPFRRGRRPNGFLGLSLNDRTVLFLVIILDKTVSVQ